MTEKHIEGYLKQFTPEQWLEAYLEMLKSYSVQTIPLNGIRAGFALAQPDGWQLVAPAWMESFENEHTKPLEAFRNEPA